MNELPRPEDELVRARQRKGARTTAWVLGAFILLVFLITIGKMMVNQ